MRAPVVAILEGGFTYFCSQECRRANPALSITPPPVAKQTGPRLHPEPEPVTVTGPEIRKPAIETKSETESESESESETETETESEPAPASVPEIAPSSRVPIPTPPPPTKIVYEDLGVEAAPASVAPPSFIRRAQETARTSDREGQALRALALVAASLGVALGLVDEGAGMLRLGVSAGATLALVAVVVLARVRLAGAKPLERAVQQNLGAPHAAAIFAAAAAIVFAFGLRAMQRRGATTMENTAIWIVLAAAVAEAVCHASARRTLDGARAVLASLEPDAETRRSDAQAKLGDVVELASGALVSSDVRIVSGSLVCDLWGNTALRSRRVEGDPVPAGAVVRSGHARARVGAVGRDRAFARLLTDALERVGRASPRLRTLDRIAPVVAISVLFIAVGVGVFGSRGQLMSTLVAGVASGLAVLIPPARRLAVRDQLAGIIEACRAGVAFRDADAFVRAGTVRTAVFCLRGTLVSAVPDTCDVEPLAGADVADVLALAAGAEIGLQHPIAAAIQRTAQARGSRPVDVRNVVYEPGFGVRGELASGAEVIVGSRALTLRAHVPTAEHEARILELEATGRDVVLVARDGRAVGLVALQYPLRAGALASVQRLHDVEVDPVILGGATRGRLEAIGKAVDVEHVRPEIAARDRGGEVKRIAQSGGPVAVIGRPSLDGPALGAAEVPIALGEAGAAPDAPAVSLAHDQLVPAVDVLALAQATRARVSATIAVGLAPVALAALPVAFALIRPTYAPLAALAATIALGVRDLVAAALPEGGRIEDN